MEFSRRSIYIPDDLWHRLAEAASLEDRSASKVARRAIEQYLGRRGPTQKPVDVEAELAKNPGRNNAAFVPPPSHARRKLPEPQAEIRHAPTCRCPVCRPPKAKP